MPAWRDEPGAVEFPLAGGMVNHVVRVGDTVRRPMGRWSPAVHDLLRYLESAGFRGAPRLLGIDGSGREVLTYIEGAAAHRPWPAELLMTDGLADLTRLLRDYHDAVANYRPSGALWRIGPAPLRDGDIIIHGDAAPWNSIWRDRRAVAFIDWDFAEPGPAILDLAYLAWYGIPLSTPVIQREAGFVEPPNLRGRLRTLCDAYGDVTPRQVLDAVATYQALDLQRIRTWGVEGKEPWAIFKRVGEDRQIEADAAWLREHYDELER